MTQQEKIDKRYADRGGWKGVLDIANDTTIKTMEDKSIAMKNKYLVSAGTGLRWLLLASKGKRMSKLHVVTSGVYSDYHICGIFSDLALATKFIKTFSTSRYGSMDIETWEIDPYKFELQKDFKPYFMRMKEDGKAYDIEISDSSYGFGDNASESYSFDIEGTLYNYCFAKDENHAIKITSELKSRLINEGQWNPENRGKQ